MKILVNTFLAILLSLAMVLPFAAEAGAAAETGPSVVARPALKVRAPNWVEIGKPVVLTVVDRSSSQPVASAEVFALNTYKGNAAATADYTGTVESAGIFLGVTGADGGLVATFNEDGRHILVAFKAGYFPGFSWITAGSRPVKGLNLKSPVTVEVGTPAAFMVTERSDGQPVAEAAIYGKRIDFVRARVINSKPAPMAFFDSFIGIFYSRPPVAPTNDNVNEAETTVVAEQADDAEDMAKNGSFLGYTDGNGKLGYAFNEAGHFALAAVKAGYNPAFARITVDNITQKSLGIKLPEKAEVNQPVTMTVFEKRTSQFMAGARIYALRLGDLLSVTPVENTSAAVLTPQSTVVSSEAMVDPEMIKSRGLYLGETGDAGQLAYSFEKSGRYVITAFRAEYIPGFARIGIGLASQKSLIIKAPDRADAGKPVNMYVHERNTAQSVAGTAVYALRLGDAVSPPALDSTVKTELTAVAETESAETIRSKGLLIGYTDDKGMLMYTFEKAGRYALAALKNEYVPGFARINIGLISQRALIIKTSDRADVGKPLSIGVIERNTAQPVTDVAVYALRLGDVIVPQMANSIVKNEPLIAVETESVENIRSRGVLIGSTDGNGIVTYTFEKTGRYVLAAVKDGYQFGFARINVLLAVQKAIGIKAPDMAAAGKPVNIVTFNINDYQPVPKAAVYALRVGEPGGPVPLPYEAMIKSQAVPAEAEKNAAEIKLRGIFLGNTNDSAQLAYAFSRPGHYLFVATRDTFSPGFARITIISDAATPNSTGSNSE